MAADGLGRVRAGRRHRGRAPRHDREGRGVRAELGARAASVEPEGVPGSLPPNDAAASALSPGDTCPDNSVFTGEGGRNLLAVVGFEGASWRHIAWDAAYLRVPWPSCRCAWRLPDDVADKAVARYRNAMAGVLPHVSTMDFDRELAAATDLWPVLYSA